MRSACRCGPPVPTAALILRGQFATLWRLVFAHLVDSNVFVRSALLSIEHFRSRLYAGDTDALGDYDPATCQVWRFISEPLNRVRLLLGLLFAVDANELCQENMCCVNTLLLILLYARLSGTLADHLGMLAAMSEAMLKRADTFQRLLSLMAFWQHYYSVRSRECWTLQANSHIAFVEWRLTAEELLRADTTRTTTVCHYL